MCKCPCKLKAMTQKFLFVHACWKTEKEKMKEKISGIPKAPLRCKDESLWAGNWVKSWSGGGGWCSLLSQRKRKRKKEKSFIWKKKSSLTQALPLMLKWCASEFRVVETRDFSWNRNGERAICPLFFLLLHPVFSHSLLEALCAGAGASLREMTLLIQEFGSVINLLIC